MKQAIFRISFITLVFLLVWQLIVYIFNLPPYILPEPIQVITAFYQQSAVIAAQALPTLSETIIGLLCATLLGSSLALSMMLVQSLRIWLLPILVISQALPIFAIAPLLVIWLGYGITSKIATTTLMLFFPITNAFFDGLRRTDSAWLDLAYTMQATSWQQLWHVRVPAALPALATGLRVATAAAPLGAILGEWVGSSRGLGFLMLNANARMQIDLMFAVLLVIIILGLLLYFSVDRLLKWAIPWQTEA